MRKNGFTLVELMIAAAVTAVALLGLLGVFSGCFSTDESSRDLTASMNISRHIVEEIRMLRDEARENPNKDFPVDYQVEIAALEVNAEANATNNLGILLDVVIDVFDNGLDPNGISNADLCWINVSISWMQKGGRIYGEDNGSGGGTALDGAINGSEDANGNGILDSPAQIITLMRR
jgi:prepilin-type N-terminal cleavage/methylation domain-containing protein